MSSIPTPQQGPPPTPENIFNGLNAFQRTAALKTAIELDLFTAIAAEAESGGSAGATAAAVARRVGAAERGVRILCDFLMVSGYLTKDGAGGAYRLAPDVAAFLDRRSPAYMGGAVEFLASPHLTGAFEELTAAVRKGGTAQAEGGSVAPENPMWVRFANAMAPLMRFPAGQLADVVDVPADRPVRVLDIAAGHGLFGLAFAQKHSDVRVVAQDWPAVLEVARGNARAAGVADDRYELLPGSAFDVDFGTGYDLVLLTNFLHHFDPPTNEALLRKVHAALADGGRAVTLEFVPDESRTSPPGAVAFGLIMLATTPAGDAYTFGELEGMFARAGFSRSELHALPMGINQAVVSHK